MKRLGYRDVRARVGHGFDGWPGMRRTTRWCRPPPRGSCPSRCSTKSGPVTEAIGPAAPLHDGEGRRAADSCASTRGPPEIAPPDQGPFKTYHCDRRMPVHCCSNSLGVK